MDNRSILAIVLIILLWSGYSLFFAPSYPTQSNDQPPPQYESPGTVTENAEAMSQVSVQETVHTVERLLSIETDLYTVVVSSYGASIRSVEFHNYKEINSNDSDNYFFIDVDSNELSTFKMFASDGINFSDDLPFGIEPSIDDFTVDSFELTFFATVNHLNVYKKYTFYNDSYHIDVDISVQNVSDDFVAGRLNFSLITPWSADEKGDFYSFSGPLTYDGSKLHEDKPKGLDKSPKLYSDFVWSGFTNKYFLQAAHIQGGLDHVFIHRTRNFVENRFITDRFHLRPSDTQSFSFVTYIGPKRLEQLSVAGADFERALHFGFFHFLSKPLFDVLRFFNSFLNNYGFSIILLTVCIKLIFWPLTHKSYKSMQGMQKLQPEMKRLKEKYADDKQRLNQEMMSFYKENKINPLGGCLPILIQIPVFFALYKVLLDSIELRHAPFIFWIADLSAKDPYYITPIIMGASMFLQQKLTPTNLDPTQEKIMLMMPVIFTFMFLGFPSGLVLYWLVNNLLTILQQLIIRRQAAQS